MATPGSLEETFEMMTAIAVNCHRCGQLLTPERIAALKSGINPMDPARGYCGPECQQAGAKAAQDRADADRIAQDAARARWLAHEEIFGD